MAHNVQYIVDDTNKLMSLIFRACADKAHQAIQLGCFSLRSGVEDGISVNIEYANKRVMFSNTKTLSIIDFSY